MSSDVAAAAHAHEGGDEDDAEPSPLLGAPDIYSKGGTASGAEAEHLRSPHGKAMKCLFGWSMLSPWCAIIGVGVSRDVYALKYHADVGVLGVLQLTHGIMALFYDVAIGWLQDKEKCLFQRRCFSKARWGRRAPWFIVHCPLMALMMYFSWAPPSLGSSFLLGWYFCVVGVCHREQQIGGSGGSFEPPGPLS